MGSEWVCRICHTVVDNEGQKKKKKWALPTYQEMLDHVINEHVLPEYAYEVSDEPLPVMVAITQEEYAQILSQREAQLKLRPGS